MRTEVERLPFTEAGFWQKCRRHARAIGRDALEQALTLYYALHSERCTLRHRTVIYGALAYLLAPIDGIPDLTPVLGYSDDLSVIAAALLAVAHAVDDSARDKAQARAQSLLG